MSVQGKASLSERKGVGRKGFLPCFISFLQWEVSDFSWPCSSGR